MIYVKKTIKLKRDIKKKDLKESHTLFLHENSKLGEFPFACKFSVIPIQIVVEFLKTCAVTVIGMMEVFRFTTSCD